MSKSEKSADVCSELERVQGPSLSMQDELVSLRARNRRLEDALRELLPLANALADRDAGDGYDDDEDAEFGAECDAALSKAIAALEGVTNA